MLAPLVSLPRLAVRQEPVPVREWELSLVLG